MPGLSLKCDFTNKTTNNSNNWQNQFYEASSSALINNTYNKEMLLKNDNYIVCCTRYAGYPVEVFENSEYWICLEGKIYDKKDSELERELTEFVSIIFSKVSSAQNDKKAITEWLLNTDGDFLIYALNKKTKDFVIVNDILCRLPLYYYYSQDKTYLIISREIQLVSDLTAGDRDDENIYDRMGVAQFLLFSYSLGKRTLLKDIHRLEPGSLLKINYDNSEFEIDSTFRFNFETKNNADRTIKENAKKMASLFSEACKNRAEGNGNNIIALSGGFDSRSVAASFHKNKIKGSAVTSTEPHWRPVVGNTKEEEVAEYLANSYGMEWENYGVMNPQSDEMLELLRLKKGLIYLTHSFLLQFLRKLYRNHGENSFTLFTGHGGDLIMANLSRGYITNIETLVRGIIRILGRFPIEDIVALTNVTETEIANEIRKILDSYPEEKLDQKLIHYIFYENNYKFSFEIEDINRYYFWTVAPFYSIHFFNYAMNCKDDDKTQHALYREFLFELSPIAASFKNSNWGCSITSRKFRLLQSFFSISWKYPFLRKVIKKIKDRKGYGNTHKIIQCIDAQVRNCSATSTYLSPTAVDRIVRNSSSYNPMGIDNLLTLTSLFEKSLCDGSTIEKYY